MCADCFKKFVGTSKQCFVCQSPVVKKKDFIQMEAGGTSFSSHNKIAVKVYTPTENWRLFVEYTIKLKFKCIYDLRSWVEGGIEENYDI